MAKRLFCDALRNPELERDALRVQRPIAVIPEQEKSLELLMRLDVIAQEGLDV
jgi:hypothetical protein